MTVNDHLNRRLLSVMLYVLILLNACIRDYYQDVPKSTTGLGMLQIDTLKTPLMSTFSYDRTNHLVDELNNCYERAKFNFGDFKLTIHLYHGLQMFAPGDTMFLNIKGALTVAMVDSNTLSIGSTLGEVMIDFLPNHEPVIKSFNFKKRVKEQYFNSSLRSKFYTEKDKVSEHRVYHECPDTAQNLIYGWYIKKVDSPKCYY